MRTAHLHRQAVDATAEDYWEKYFGEYGKQWVRKIPRRIAHALLRRTASAQVQGRALDAAMATARIHTLGHVVQANGGLATEGVLYCDAPQLVRPFRAEFDAEGVLIHLASLPVE